MIWVAVAVAGGAGAACRYLVDYLVTARSHSDYPWGTLAVNLSGAFLIGLIAGTLADQGSPSVIRTVLAGGFCGAYTTFSTLVYETWRLIEDRAYRHAAANLTSVPLGGLVAAAGWIVTAT